MHQILTRLMFAFAAACVVLPAAAAQAPNIATPLSGITVAVLPFANAGEADQDFLADGLTDEVSLALTHVPGLTPMARTSGYRFKGSKDTPQANGRALGAANVVTGTTRRVPGATDRVRVSAKLIRVGDGKELWSNDYYAEFPALFDIEEDIASNVATALGKTPGGMLVPNRTANMEAYENYLRARPFVRGRNAKSFAEAAALLEKAVAQDGNFVPALSLLAFDYDITPLYNEARRTGRIAEARKVVDEVVPKAEALAKRAIARDASRADAHAALAYAYMVQGKMVLSEAAFKQALARDANGTDALHGYSQLLGAFGRIADSLAMRKHLQALEPFFINYVADTAEIFWLDGDDDTALAMLDQFRPGRTSELAQVKASLGRYKEAADHLREMTADNYPPGILELAAKTLEGGPAAAKAANLPDFGTLDWIFVYTGAPERAMAYYENNLAAGYFQPISSTWFWHPSYAALRKSARFKAFAKTIGFADVWRTSGIWPQQCHTVGESDFVCN